VYDTQQQLVEVEEAMVAAKQRAEKHALQLKERLQVAQESAAEVQFLKHQKMPTAVVCLNNTHCSVFYMVKMLGH
jgi:hypothetical protein